MSLICDYLYQDEGDEGGMEMDTSGLNTIPESDFPAEEILHGDEDDLYA